MKVDLTTYSLLIVAVLINLGLVIVYWQHKSGFLGSSLLPVLLPLNGIIVFLYLLYREISKIREHLNIPSLTRPNRTPFQPGFAPIEEQVRLSVADALKSEAIDNSDKLLSSIQRKLVRIETVIGFKSHPESLFPSDQSSTLQETLTSIDKKLDQYLSQFQMISQINPSHQIDFKLLERRVEDLENLSANQETNNSIELLDLPIMLYIRKNGNTSLQELLNNIHCDEENLKERLIALQKENLIHIADDHDPQNPIYRL